LNSELAQRRADELQERLQRRLKNWNKNLQLSPQPPLVIGAALILPAGLIAKLQGKVVLEPGLFARQKKAVEEAAMQAVMENERKIRLLTN
jgi:hypothetical protein